MDRQMGSPFVTTSWRHLHGFLDVLGADFLQHLVKKMQQQTNHIHGSLSVDLALVALRRRSSTCLSSPMLSLGVQFHGYTLQRSCHSSSVRRVSRWLRQPTGPLMLLWVSQYHHFGVQLHGVCLLFRVCQCRCFRVCLAACA
jgi:hypothetical protein